MGYNAAKLLSIPFFEQNPGVRIKLNLHIHPMLIRSTAQHHAVLSQVWKRQEKDTMT